MSVSIHNERFKALYRPAEKRDLANSYVLDIGFGQAMWVGSYSNPENSYYVKITGDDVLCSCKAGEVDQACTHASVCVAHYKPSIWLQWEQEDAKFLDLRHRIQTNDLSRSEKRKLAKAMRARVNKSADTAPLMQRV